ncbi:MAG: Lrp/AsnC family transcriptional regulator [Thermoprotei archaeon]|nr:MAG: AsnC family transcriptional regulator [Desulfurococcales archaeon ex4484_217_2]RLG73932.1 MAG: Lrp/AsnC family transcriptional regulator [Thermoprotei archaeon]
MSEEKIIAYVLLNIALGKEHEVKEKASKLDHVTEVKIVYGEFDIVVRIEAPTFKALDRTVSSLRSMDGVLKTITLIASS